MSYKTVDRVKETSTTTGTGTYTLAGAVAGFRTFSTHVGNGNRCTYVATDGTDFEIGQGTVGSGTLTRDKILDGSNGGSAVNWAAGTRTIFCAPSAADRNPRTRALTSAHSISSTTATEVTGLELTDLQPGTYNVRYKLICQMGTTTGIGLGLNFTGTHSKLVAMRYHVATITTASNGLVEEESGAALKTGGVMNAWATKAESTTAPTMVNEGAGAAAADVLEIIDVVIVVTAAGNLELWHSSEAAAATSLEVGSSVVCHRIDD